MDGKLPAISDEAHFCEGLAEYIVVASLGDKDGPRSSLDHECVAQMAMHLIEALRIKRAMETPCSDRVN